MDLRINETFQVPIYRGCSPIASGQAESAPVRLGNRPYRGAKVDSLLYHDLLDCDPSLQTNSLRYLWQIA